MRIASGALLFVAFVTFRPTAIAQTPPPEASAEGAFLANVRQVTFEGRRAGEGYFNAEGSKMIFQSERESDNPFYQIYVLDLGTGDSVRVSPGRGKTTCAWFHPDGARVMFSSTHEDPRAGDKEKAEFELRAAGKSRRYKFEYDPHFDIYEARADGSGGYVNLTAAPGYDAEGSYSPDGRLIAFASNRHAYAERLTPEAAQRLELTPEYFNEIYICNADGSAARRLTFVPGYDGGPFFSPDGKRLCWRRFTEDGTQAEVWTMNVDGTGARQITRLGAMSWAPFYHPTGDYLIFTTNLHGFGNFELYIVDAEGARDPVRVTYTDGFDGLPVFLPDGRRLAWTTTRTADQDAQIFFADWNDAEARRRLKLEVSATSANAPRCTPDRQLPETGAEISAADLTAHADALAASLARSAPDQAADPQPITDYVAAVFCKLGLEPAGERASLFQVCELPVLRGDDTRFVGCNVLGRLRADRPTGPPILIGTHVSPSDGGGDRHSRLAGAAGLLEIAEQLVSERAAGKLQLKHDVIFATFVGESLSAGFVADGLGALVKPEPGAPAPFAAYLSLDGIGSGDAAVTVSGVGSSPVWPGEIERRNVPIGLHLRTQEAPDPATTAFQFYAASVPAIGLTAEAPAALAAGLKADGAARVARFVGLIARGLATSEASPPFTPIGQREGASAGSPYLGTEPDYRGRGPGVLLTGVAEGGPAEHAGVRPGDVIVELGGKPIDDIQTYADTLDGLTIGRETTIVVVRDQQRMTLSITPGQRP